MKTYDDLANRMFPEDRKDVPVPEIIATGVPYEMVLQSLKDNPQVMKIVACPHNSDSNLRVVVHDIILNMIMAFIIKDEILERVDEKKLASEYFRKWLTTVRE